MIDGVEYAIDVTEPARYDESGALVAPQARRIRDLAFKGAPIDPEQAFLVVTNNYRASGGGGFPGLRRNERGDRGARRQPRRRPQIHSKRERSRAEVGRQLAPRALAGTVVATYLTSPAAAALPAPRGLRLTSMGAAPGGFLKLRVESV